MLSTNPLDPYSVAKSFNFIVAVNSKIHRPPCLTELQLVAGWGLCIWVELGLDVHPKSTEGFVEFFINDLPVVLRALGVVV
jgi:hypothetical protein